MKQKLDTFHKLESLVRLVAERTTCHVLVPRSTEQQNLLPRMVPRVGVRH